MTLTIATARHEIMWRDGSAVGVHPVLRDGVPEMYLRALPGHPAIVIDLRRVAPGIEQDMAPAPHRDRAGVVFYTLRHRYRNAREFFDAAVNAGRVDMQALQLEAAA